MQLLGLSFPPDFERTAETIKELPIEYMLRIRSEFNDNFTSYKTLFDDLQSRIVFTYCDICDEEEASYDDMPEGWGWYDAGVGWYKMCNDCQTRYAEKFNELPKVVRDI